MEAIPFLIEKIGEVDFELILDVFRVDSSFEDVPLLVFVVDEGESDDLRVKGLKNLHFLFINLALDTLDTILIVPRFELTNFISKLLIFCFEGLDFPLF